LKTTPQKLLPEADVIRSTSLEDVHQKLKYWKLQSLLKVIIFKHVIAEGIEAWRTG
jgi:hypothetical protein